MVRLDHSIRLRLWLRFTGRAVESLQDVRLGYSSCVCCSSGWYHRTTRVNREPLPHASSSSVRASTRADQTTQLRDLPSFISFSL